MFVCKRKNGGLIFGLGATVLYLQVVLQLR